MSSLMASTYSVSSLTGLVSSKRRLHTPPNASAIPKSMHRRLGMSDVQVTIGFGRETGLNVIEAAVVQVFFNGVSDEIAGRVKLIHWSSVPLLINIQIKHPCRNVGCFMTRLRAKDSNLYMHIQSVQSCHWTSPQ